MVTDQYGLPTTSVLVATFLVQNRMIWIELAAGRMIEDTTIYKKNTYHGYDIWEGFKVLIAMIWQCMDFIIHMYVEKTRYPEIHQNKIIQCSYWFSDPHRTNPIQHNNQLMYESNKWWRFWVRDHFNEWYDVFCCFSTHKIISSKLRFLSLYIKHNMI